MQGSNREVKNLQILYTTLSIKVPHDRHGSPFAADLAVALHAFLQFAATN
jgi:hypothetical protein